MGQKSETPNVDWELHYRAALRERETLRDQLAETREALQRANQIGATLARDNEVKEDMLGRLRTMVAHYDAQLTILRAAHSMLTAPMGPLTVVGITEAEVEDDNDER